VQGTHRTAATDERRRCPRQVEGPARDGGHERPERFAEAAPVTVALLDADPRISAYLDQHKAEDVDLCTLKSDRLYAVRHSDESSLREWPIYRCFVYETELHGDLYVLSAGE
jgi:uncharacterized protein DUF6119